MSSNRPDDTTLPPVTRRDFVQSAMVGATAFALGDRRVLFASAASATERDVVFAQITAQHDVTLKMLQEWIARDAYPAKEG